MPKDHKEKSNTKYTKDEKIIKYVMLKLEPELKLLVLIPTLNGKS
jgi:hypothetical protein